MTIRVHLGDCRNIMAGMREASFDSICCDPPYELDFMGCEWDRSGIAYDVNMWREALRVLKPGAHLAAFSGTRTYHRMAVAIEDAGFEIRDQLAWVYGSGFPKSGGLKPAWEPICLARKPCEGSRKANIAAHATGGLNIDACRIDSSKDWPASKRMTPGQMAGGRGNLGGYLASTAHDGLGRYPANVIHDGSEEVLAGFPVTTSGTIRPYTRTEGSIRGAAGCNSRECLSEREGDSGSAARFFYCAQLGELDQCNLDLASYVGEPLCLQNAAVVFALARAVTRSTRRSVLTFTDYQAPNTSASANELRRIATLATAAIQNIESACWPASRQERLILSVSHAECVAVIEPTGIITTTISRWTSSGYAEPVIFSSTLQSVEAGGEDWQRRAFYSAKAGPLDRLGSEHPTVKPVDLMRWLARLITPAGGTILDPFAGSGTTGIAALAEGFGCEMIDLMPAHVADIEQKLAHLRGDGGRIVERHLKRKAARAVEPLALFA